MLVGYVDQLTPHVVGGWAAETDAPESTVSVAIYVDERRIATVACDGMRPDLQVRGDLGGHVRHGFRYEFTPPLELDRTGRVTVRFAGSAAILRDGVRLGRRPRVLTPILVSAPARSGTTFLMHRLSQSTKVCLAEVPPFEVRLLAYWSAVYRTLTAPPDFDKSTHPDRPEGDGVRVGSNPYADLAFAKAFGVPALSAEYFGSFVPSATADFIRTVIAEYYLRIRDDQGKQSAMYFAEKCNSLYQPTRVNSRLFFPGLKEIIIVRDPRDILGSHMSFFQKGAESAFRDISEHCQELLRVSHAPLEGQYIAKYEDLVTGNADALARLSEFLDVADLGGDQEKEGAMFQVHATSKSPKDSIGRWRKMPPEEIRRCNSAWSVFLQTFGYER